MKECGSMNFIVEVVDKNGEKIDCDVKIDSGDITPSFKNTNVRIIIDNLETDFTDDELIELLELIDDKVEYGCPIELTKKYIELYDKINDLLKKRDI